MEQLILFTSWVAFLLVPPWLIKDVLFNMYCCSKNELVTFLLNEFLTLFFYYSRCLKFWATVNL
jgi:hypothetical protein